MCAGIVQTSYRQQTRGRPGPSTRYQRVDKKDFKLSWQFLPEQLRNDDHTDGLFPLMTNDQTLTPLAALELYKRLSRLEKRHEQFKQVLEIMPVNLKTPARMEAFVFVYLLALLLHGFLERELRQAVRTRGIKSLPLYPEARDCERPMAEKVLEPCRGAFVTGSRARLQPGTRLLLLTCAIPGDVVSGFALVGLCSEYAIEGNPGAVIPSSMSSNRYTPTTWLDISFCRLKVSFCHNREAR